MRADATCFSDAPHAGATRVKRLCFRAWRRGFKEADLVLGGFADAHAAALDAEDLDRFEALLEEPDDAIYAWITGLAAPPPQHDHDLFARIRRFALTACADASEGRA